MNNKQKTLYPYHDENNNILYTKIRVEHEDGSKDFLWLREENGLKIYNLNGCRKVLYRLPYVLMGIKHNKTIFLVEGEKDANTLLNKTIIATTSSSSLEWSDEFTEILKNADVAILYDYDKTGLKRRDLLTEKLYGNVKKLRVVELPSLEYRENKGQDITDWLQIGHTIEELKTLVEQTCDYVPKTIPNQSNKLKAITLAEFLTMKLPEREMLLAPFLPSQGLVLLVAKRGVGKTHIALGIAYAVAVGGTFLCWTAPAAKKVIYVDGEMPAILMQERLHMIRSMSDKKDQNGFFNLLTPDYQNKIMPNLSTKTGRDEIEEIIKDYDLIILDNISCLFRSGSENDAECWQEAQEWALDLRRRGKSVLFVHHAGKSGVQRGTSKKEDILDTVLILKQPDDYKPEEGARFEVIFDKSRHFTGEDARSFNVHLIEESEGIWKWELSNTPKEEQIMQIVEMKKRGMTIEAIKKATKLSKAQIEWRTAKARERGLL